VLERNGAGIILRETDTFSEVSQVVHLQLCRSEWMGRRGIDLSLKLRSLFFFLTTAGNGYGGIVGLLGEGLW